MTTAQQTVTAFDFGRAYPGAPPRPSPFLLTHENYRGGCVQIWESARWDPTKTRRESRRARFRPRGLTARHGPLLSADGASSAAPAGKSGSSQRRLRLAAQKWTPQLYSANKAGGEGKSLADQQWRRSAVYTNLGCARGPWPLTIAPRGGVYCPRRRRVARASASGFWERSPAFS